MHFLEQHGYRRYEDRLIRPYSTCFYQKKIDMGYMDLLIINITQYGPQPGVAGTHFEVDTQIRTEIKTMNVEMFPFSPSELAEQLDDIEELFKGLFERYAQSHPL